MIPVDIGPSDLETVRRILYEQALGLEVRVFGSRLSWTARGASDLDLALMTTEPLDIGRMAALKAAFTESDLPFRVDIVDWASTSESFRKVIEREHVVLAVPEDTPFGGDSSGVVGRWPTDRFERLLVEPVRNGIYKRREFHGRGAKIVNMGELFAHPRLRAVPMKRVELSESEADRFLITAGDLLFARRSLVAEGAGKCCVVLDVDEPTTFESSIIRARPDSTKADHLYLYYFFNSALGLYRLDTIRRQVAVAGITGSDLAKLDIPVPPPPEQRAIAHILGTLDDKIELNRRMNETLEVMARALFKSWFVDFDPVRAKMEGRDTGLSKHISDIFPDRLVDSEIGRIPEGWEPKALGECFNLTMGQSPPGSSYNDCSEGLPFFQGRTDFGFRYPENRKFCTAPSRIAWPGDTLVSVRAPVGDINMAWTQCCIGRGVSALRHKSASSSFTYYSAWTIQENISVYEHTGTVFGAINKKQFEALQTLEPKSELIEAFDANVSPLDSRIRGNTSEVRTLASLRDALLPRLISGDLRLKDADTFIQRVL